MGCARNPQKATSQPADSIVERKLDSYALARSRSAADHTRFSTDPSAAVRAAVQSLDAELQLRDVSRLSAALEHQTWFLRVFGKIFGSFAFIGLVMASVGIYA